MSKWMGHPHPSEEDLPDWMKEYPYVAEFYVSDRRMRINLVLDNELTEKFLAYVKKKYGKANPANIRKAALQALEELVKKG